MPPRGARDEDRAASVTDVLDLFDVLAGQRYDEEVTQLEHALQVAALAQLEAAPGPLVAAGLLHDVGHLLELRDGGEPTGHVEDDPGHEARGARWLAGLFPASVTGPIALHVAAKRYLCSIDPTYVASLSVGSTVSLTRQGGPMGDAERRRFQAHPAHDAAVRLRRWDDTGKSTESLDIPELDAYRPLLEALARATWSTSG